MRKLFDLCFLRDKERCESAPVGGCSKPVLYFYPQAKTAIKVIINLKGKFTAIYPNCQNAIGDNYCEWDIIAYPNGKISLNQNQKNDTKEEKEKDTTFEYIDEGDIENETKGNDNDQSHKSIFYYNYIFWEGDAYIKPDFSEGAIVEKDNVVEFLEQKLNEIGLNEGEINEFIVYWFPILKKNEYNLISFQKENYCEGARLDITPKPDSLLRVFMQYKGYKEKPSISLPPQKFEKFERKGFTVVEWGGGSQFE